MSTLNLLYQTEYQISENLSVVIPTVGQVLDNEDELKRIASLMLSDKKAISLQLPNTEMCFE